MDIVIRIMPHGEIRWLHVIGMCSRDAAGKPVRWAGSVNDITERKLAEEELRRSQHYLARAQRLSHIGSSAFTAAGFRHWSPELFKIHGLDPGGKAPSVPEYLALVHPEDRDFVVQEIEKMLAGAPGFDFTKRIVRPDGAIRYVRCVGTRASTGGIVPEFVGMGMDITEQERAADAVRASEARFRGLTELSSDWYWEQDENLRFTYLSNQALDLTGYTGESSLGKHRWEIVNMTPLSCSWPEHRRCSPRASPSATSSAAASGRTGPCATSA